ncbi:MAG: ribonuclease PH [Rickettsiaceae bacterium]
MRPSKRLNDQIRDITIKTHTSVHHESSCIIKCGNTEILCCATYEESTPYFLRGLDHGWLTAEYSLLPSSTHTRVKREAVIGKQSSRTQEIQRLIGRSLRSVINLNKLNQRQIVIDCDVINADGGTRVTAITGSYVALNLLVNSLIKKKKIKQNIMIDQIAAISCGIYNNEIIVDLDYQEDKDAQVDANFVFTKDGKIVEIQSTAEKTSFTQEQFISMLNLAQSKTQELFAIQDQILSQIS